MNRIVPLIMLVAGTSAAHGQSVRGRVLVEGTDRPVSQAAVSVLAGARDTVLATQLAADGTFALALPAAGSYRLRVEALGYTTLTTSVIMIEPSMVMTVELRVREEAIALEPLRVVAQRIEPPFMSDVRERQKMGFGKLVTREELDQRFGSYLEDVLRDAGLTVEYVRMGQQSIPLITGHQSARRAMLGLRCYSALYVNGMRQFPSIMNPTGANARTGVLDTAALPAVAEMFQFRPQDVEVIEIYRNRGETPAIWADEMSECGVVAVWLRSGYDRRAAEEPYTGPMPKASVDISAASQQLSGRQAPAHATAYEAAVNWRAYRQLSVAVRVRRSVHVLPAATTQVLMHGMEIAGVDVTPGDRPMTLVTLTGEPRIELRRDTRLSPFGALRLQVARRSFDVNMTALLNRTATFASLGVGLGGAAGATLRLHGRFSIEASAAYDRLFFGDYPQLERPYKNTATTWSGTSLRLGVTTRLWR